MHKRRRKDKIGIPPGSLVYVGKNKIPAVSLSLFDYTPESFLEKTLTTIEEAYPYIEQSTFTWLHICGIPDPQMIGSLGRQLGWHPLVQEDILFTGQRPKIDDYNEYIYIVLRMLLLNPVTKDMEDEQVSLVLGKNYLVTISESGNHFLETMKRQLSKEGSLMRQQAPDYLAYAVIDGIVDYYFVVIEGIDDQLEKLEKNLINKPGSKLLFSILKKKRDVISLRKHVWPMREVVRTFQKNESLLIYPTTRLFLNDVYDHTIQAIETVEGLRDMTDDMVEIHLSNANQRLNQIMTILTVITSIFVPMTFIASIYGMNFKNMPELEWQWGYPTVLGVMALLAISMLYYFYKKKWL